MSVAAAAGTVQSGKPAGYVIKVWTVGGRAHNVIVQTAVGSGALPSPAFTSCDSGTGTQNCSIGVLTQSQTAELLVQISVPSTFEAGLLSTLTATVSGLADGATTAGSVTGSASESVVAPPTPTPTPTKTKSPSHHRSSGRHHHSGGSGPSPSSSELNGTVGATSPLGILPSLPGTGSSGSTTNPGSLFPTITPSSTASSTKAHHLTGPYRATTVSDVLPLNTRQMSGQVAGLVVLALGIVIAIARISVRRPRSSPGKH